MNAYTDGLLTFFKNLINHTKTWYDKPSIFGGLLLSSLVINILALAFPLVLLQVYDRILPNESINTLFLLVVLVIIIVIIESFLKITRSIIIAWSDTRYDYKTSEQLFKSIVESDLTELSKHASGEYLERMRAVQDLKNYYGNQALTGLLDLPFVLIFLWLVAFLGGWLIVVPVGMLIILFLSIINIGLELEDEIHDKQNKNDRRMNFLVEIFSGIHTIKALALEPFMLRRYERLQDQTSETNYKLSLLNSKIQNSMIIISQMSVIFTVAFGAMFVIQGNLTIGGLAACTLLSSRVLQPVSRSIGLWHRFKSITQAEDSISSIFALKQDKRAIKIKDENMQIEGNYHLEDVSFSYNQIELFKSISFEIKQGDTVAILGNNLSGKSTLLMMLAGLTYPTEGKIKLDGQSIFNYSSEILAEKISYLPQSSSIFSGTVLDNITMFRPELNDKAIKTAEEIGLDVIINRLPQGFETVLGESIAELLPSGVNQLITIARGLIIDPKIILFDEANATLDLQSDQKINNVLLSYKGKSTIIMATHRPSLIKNANLKLHIQNKKIFKAD